MEPCDDSLSAAVQKLTTSINEQNVDITIAGIERFHGETVKFSKWINDLEICFQQNLINDDQMKINIAMMTSEGIASAFVEWWVDFHETPGQTFELLKERLTKHFGPPENYLSLEEKDGTEREHVNNDISDNYDSDATMEY